MKKKKPWFGKRRRKTKKLPVDLSLPFHEQIAQLQHQIDRRREGGEQHASPPSPRSPIPKKVKTPKKKAKKNQSPPKVSIAEFITEIKISREDLKLATHAWLYLPIDPKDKTRIRWKLCVCMLLYRTPNVKQLAKQIQSTEEEIIEAVRILKKLKEATSGEQFGQSRDS